jgi:arylsulfatase A-like enzyme
MAEYSVSKISRRQAMRLLGSAAALSPLSLVAHRMQGGAPRQAPNVLVFLTDDQRFDSMSAAGNRILETPNIDRIAAGGTRFAEAFCTNALCAPSRASILTGLYSHVHGVTTNGDGPAIRNQPGLRDDQVTFVHLLRQAGYRTAVVGKWHIPSRPLGFDDWAILPGQGVYLDPEMIANGTRLKFRGHVDDVVGDQALSILRNRQKDRPFCLLCHFKSPHRAWVPAPRFEHAFDAVEIPEPATFNDTLEGRPAAVRQHELSIATMPDFAERGVPASLPPAERKRRNFQAMVKNIYRVLLSVDENVGRVLDYLDKEGLTENTVVLFASDNGFFHGEHGFFDKRLMYEPSIRVPFVWRFPARFATGRVDSSHTVLNIDVAPTMLELCGVPVPVWMQGRSLVPLLESAKNAAPPWRDAFFYEYFEYPAEHCVRKNRGVRTDRWKLIQYWEQPEEWELYDLKADPDEVKNLANAPEHGKQKQALQVLLDRLRREVGSVDPPGPAPISPPCRRPAS